LPSESSWALANWLQSRAFSKLVGMKMRAAHIPGLRLAIIDQGDLVHAAGFGLADGSRLAVANSRARSERRCTCPYAQMGPGRGRRPVCEQNSILSLLSMFGCFDRAPPAGKRYKNGVNFCAPRWNFDITFPEKSGNFVRELTTIRAAA
jgi:hypothetical protein